MKDWTSKLPARVKLEKAVKKANGGEEEAPRRRRRSEGSPMARG